MPAVGSKTLIFNLVSFSIPDISINFLQSEGGVKLAWNLVMVCLSIPNDANILANDAFESINFSILSISIIFPMPDVSIKSGPLVYLSFESFVNLVILLLVSLIFNL